MTRSAMLSQGTEILGYRIERTIGRGGMGVVYLAEQVVLNRLVALKLLAPELADDDGFRARFLRESRLAASLDHPHIVPVHDAGEVEGWLYIAMRYVEGTDLGRLLEGEAPLEPSRAIALLAPVADALDAAHARGLVHRDVKPSNVLLDQAERPYLADFGVARQASERGLVEPSHFAASFAYVAPEQIEGKPLDGRADLYALGCVLFECITGAAPFGKESPVRTLWRHLSHPPPTAGDAIDSVFARALAKEPSERYESCSDLIRDASAALDLAAPRSRKRLLVAPAVVTVAAAAAFAAFVFGRGDAGPAKPNTSPTLTPEVDALQHIDPSTNELVATLRLSSDPTGVAVGAGAVWTIHFDDNTVSKIDPRTNAVVATGSAPAPEAVAVGDGSVWVAGGDGSVAQLDVSTGLSVHTIAVPSSAQPAELAAYGAGGVWIASQLTGVVARINPRSCSVSTAVETGALKGAVRGIAVGEGAVWVASSNILAADYRVVRIDQITRRVAASIPLSRGAEGVTVGERHVWVVNSFGDTVSQIDPSSNRLVRTIPVGRGPVAVAVSPGAVWVANYRDGTVSRVDPNQGRVVETIRVGPNPDAIAAGEDGVWVAVHVR